MAAAVAAHSSDDSGTTSDMNVDDQLSAQVEFAASYCQASCARLFSVVRCETLLARGQASYTQHYQCSVMSCSTGALKHGTPVHRNSRQRHSPPRGKALNELNGC